MPHPADIDALILVLPQDGVAAQRARDELAALGEPAVRRLLEVIDGTASLAFPEGTYPQDLIDGLTGGLVAAARGRVRVLIDAIAERPARGRSTSVLWALGALADPLGVPILLEALRDRSWSARWAAAHGLGACGDAEVTPALAKAVSDRDSSVRGAAVGALARVGDLRAREALERAIVDPANAGSPGIVNAARAVFAAIEARAGVAPAAAARPARGGEQEVVVFAPELGEEMGPARVVRLLVEEADQVAHGQALVEIETEKASIEIPAPEAGVVGAIAVRAGDAVQSGTPLVVLRCRVR